MTPSLKCLGNALAAVSAVHALLALGQACRSKLWPRLADAAEVLGCPCPPMLKVRVELTASEGPAAQASVSSMSGWSSPCRRPAR